MNKEFPSWIVRTKNYSVRCALAVLCLGLPVVGMCSVSGVYVATYTNGVAMMQLVETPDHHLRGSHQVVAVNQNSEITRTNSEIVGAVDGSNLSISLSNNSKAISAVMSGSSIRVVGLDDHSTIFQKSSLDAFEKKVSSLKLESQSALARKAEDDRKAKFVSNVINVNGSMSKLISVSEKIAQELKQTEKRLQDITQKMAALYEKERHLAGNSSVNANSARMQIVSALMQGQSATQRLQWDFDALQNNFRDNQQPTYNRANEFEVTCRSSKEVSACNTLIQNLPLYREKYDAMTKSLDAWSATYQVEKANQDRIFKQAEALQ